MKSLKYLFTIVLIALFFVGCKYDFIVPEEVPVIDPDDPDAEEISFSADIIPIFESKCVACHTTGKQLPDLSAANAFSSLNSTRYINSTPEESLIYTRPNPDNTDSHPKYSETEAVYVLGWIQQGAKNN
ncbi:hypothetical protein [Maribellus maritimus]|uniref:hypothetical protein n=1 Tax=Maribellus maritimus TaxID=2870838 RepID=UPI001EEB6DF2|nr:hypothetical protein [Maribellus maritimus]MCG6189256.1 hypothetical protein [Maribellus maritimus]